ncbi:unnamed protein product [Mucor hiemalis]
MSTFNSTRVYLNTKPAKFQQSASIYRSPVPLGTENFYFNQEAVKVAVCFSDTNGHKVSKASLIASVHLTNKRLILLAQSTSIAPTKPDLFDTCEFQLSDFKSLKSELTYNKGLRFDIKTIRNEKIRIDLKFNNKKDAARRESLREYIKMATSAMLASRMPSVGIPLQRQYSYTHDGLPSYLEATTNTHVDSIAPPAYS